MGTSTRPEPCRRFSDECRWKLGKRRLPRKEKRMKSIQRGFRGLFAQHRLVHRGSPDHVPERVDRLLRARQPAQIRMDDDAVETAVYKNAGRKTAWRKVPSVAGPPTLPGQLDFRPDDRWHRTFKYVRLELNHSVSADETCPAATAPSGSDMPGFGGGRGEARHRLTQPHARTTIAPRRPAPHEARRPCGPPSRPWEGLVRRADPLPPPPPGAPGARRPSGGSFP